MRSSGLKRVLDHLRTVNGGGLSDAQLLARFIDGREDAAFAALVHRHGKMVLGVCRRILGHAQDAEDAFQATFLVLARKAASVVKREALASFLYGVAYRTALEARTAAVRRRTRERQVVEMPHPEAPPQEAQDWRPVLDRELNALPEKYKAPVVLCDLEGKTRREAARQLGLSEGTLSSQLTRARRLLAKRLSRQGLALSGGALATVLAEEAASAAVPVPWAISTVRAAKLVAAGRAAVATPAALLMNEVLKAMLMTKLKFAVTAVMMAVMLGAGGLVYQASGQSEGKQPDRPRTEVEALRHEVELLKFNLELVLEKCRAQEAELRALRGRGAAPQGAGGRGMGGFGGGASGPSSSSSTMGAPMGGSVGNRASSGSGAGQAEGSVSFTAPAPGQGGFGTGGGAGSGGAAGQAAGSSSFAGPAPGQGAFSTGGSFRSRTVNPEQAVEAALKAFREAPDNEAKQRAARRLESALKEFRQQLQPTGDDQPPNKR
jgi:RNA polymerase sigma factor (sigma-70 family)